MADTLTLKGVGPNDPAVGGVAIDYAAADQTFTRNVRALYIATAGTLKVDLADGSTVTFASLAAGTIYPLRVTKIYMTGSSSAAGLALY